MNRIHKTISPLDAHVLRELHDEADLRMIANKLRISMKELRGSMRRLAARLPVKNEMRIVEP